MLTSLLALVILALWELWPYQFYPRILGGGHLPASCLYHVLPHRSHCVAHLIWLSKAPWAGPGKSARRRLIHHFLPPYPLTGKPPLCAVLLPRSSQSSLAFPMLALSLRGS